MSLSQSIDSAEIDYNFRLSVDGRRGRRGVRLAADRVRWTQSGRDCEALFADIAEISLRFVQHIFICRIRFRHGLRLGFVAPEFGQPATAYGDFVRRLHARLGPSERASIRFVKGWSEGAYVTARAGFWVLCVVVLIALLGDLSRAQWGMLSGVGRDLISAVLVGSLLGMPLLRNAPGSYDPDSLPQELVPDAGGGRQPDATGSRRPIGDPVYRAASIQPLPAGARAPDDVVRQCTAPSDTMRGASDGPAYDLYAQDQSGVLGRAARLVRDRIGWRIGGAVLGIAAVGLVSAAVWAAGIHETARMFEPGEVQRALELTRERAGPPSVFVRAVEVTAGRLRITTVDPLGKGRMVKRWNGEWELSRWERWQVSHAVVYSGWQEWDRVSGPEPIASGIGEDSFVYLNSNNARLIGEIVQKALAGATLEAGEATIVMEYTGTHTGWDAVSRNWVARPRQWAIKISDARGNSWRSFATDPTVRPPRQ